MYRVNSINVLLLSLHLLSTPQATSFDFGMTPKITIRQATIHDLQDIARVATSVYHQLPDNVYEYPYADRYPEDYRECKLVETQNHLTNYKYPEKDLYSMVAEIEGDSIVIAHAVWDLVALEDKQAKVSDVSKVRVVPTKGNSCDGRRDANWKRIEYYNSLVLPTMWRLLEPSNRTSWPRGYIHLERLATTPEWQRHGAGTALINWGLDLAGEHGLTIGLFATSSGQGLYEKLGFEQLEQVFVQMPGEEESVTMTAMQWSPKTDAGGVTFGILDQITFEEL